MKERPHGAVARATAVAEGFAVAARRRAQDREPRVVLYDEEGLSFLLKPSARGYDAVLERATQMVEIVAPPPPPPAASGRRGTRPER